MSNALEVIEYMEGVSGRYQAAAERDTIEYVRGLHHGKADAYELAAQWMREALSLPLPPDPEDEENTELELEEVLADAEGGNV